MLLARMSDRPQETDRSLGGLFKHSLIYSLVPIVSRAAGFLMIPVYWHFISKVEWGLAGMGELYLNAFSQLLGVNLIVSAMSRFFFDQKSDRDRHAVVSSCTLVLGALAWVLCGAGLLFRDELAPILLGDYDGSGGAMTGSDFLALVLLIVPFRLSGMAGLTYLQIKKKSGLYSSILLVKVIGELGLRVWTIAFAGMGVRGYMLSMLIGEAALALLLTTVVLVRVKPRVDWRVFRPILLYTVPLIPVGLCQVALHQLDKRLLEFLAPTGQEAVGVYYAGYQFGMLVNMLMLSPFMQIWLPWIYGVEERQERARLVARVSTYAVLAIGAASVGLILFGRQVTDLVDTTGKYAVAYRVIPLVASGYVFWALYHASQLPLFIAKRTGPLFAINLAALMANVLLNVVLIPVLDFQGAAVATLGTFALLALLGMTKSHEEADVPFEVGRLVVVLLSVLFAAAVSMAVDVVLVDGRGWGVVSSVGLKVGALGVVAAVLWWVVLRGDERRDLAEWVRGKVRRG